MGDDDDHRSSINQRIMVAMFVCSFFFVLLLIVLHLYSRYLLRGRQRRRHAIFLYGLGRPTRPDVENSIEEPPKRGLDRLVIASLPTFPYKPANQSIATASRSEPVECSICLGAVVEGDMVRELPNCKHLFHVECIDMWLGSNSTCPICRTDAEPRVQPQPVDQKDMETVQPSAPPLEGNNMAPATGAHIAKEGGSGSRLTSFRGMLNREWSLRTRSCRDEIRAEDIEER